MTTIKYEVKHECFVNAYKGQSNGNVCVHSDDTGELLLRVDKDDVLALAEGCGNKYGDSTEEKYRRVTIQYVDKSRGTSYE